MVEIIYARAELIDSFHAAIDAVARERIYVEMIEAPPLAKVREHQLKLISINGPSFYAVEGDRVVGWADVFPFESPRMNHRGSLGMGLIDRFRGRGLGGELLRRCLEQSSQCGIEKVELTVYTTNLPAIRLYRKLGFFEEGMTKNYRKLDGRYFDCLRMAKFCEA